MDKPLLENLLYEPGILENAVQQLEHELNDETAFAPIRYYWGQKKMCENSLQI